MTVEEFRELMQCNEPDFLYHGQQYSICWPDGNYYVTASDSPSDAGLKFKTLDELLDCWLVQGHRFRDILPDIELG